MMGAEPLQMALAEGVDFVLAGRCSDTALYAAMPVMRGFPAGLAWHAGKVVECGTMACVTAGKGVMLVRLRHDDFIVRPFGQGLRCTPQSIAAHSLYENVDPFHFTECSGTVDITEATYEAVDAITVRVANSRFIRTPLPGRGVGIPALNAGAAAALPVSGVPQQAGAGTG